MVCINKNHPEYQALKQKSGIQESELEAICQDYMDRLNRFPYLDEIPGANSENSLRETLKINQNGGVKMQTIREVTGEESQEKINATLNNSYRDLEVNVIPLNQEAIVQVEHRPNKYVPVFNYSEIQFSDTPNNVQLLNESLYRLANLYGITFETVTAQDGFDNNVNAFIKDGKIYINTDVASFDAPLHEMMHLFLGAVRYTNPVLYNKLTQFSESLPNYEEILETFENRTRGDINEELLIQEYAKYAVGKDSLIDQLTEEQQYEIQYNINRVLDSVLFGENSVSNIPKDILYTSSINQLAKIVNSAINQQTFFGSIDNTSRIMYNTKAELLKEAKLKEYC